MLVDIFKERNGFVFSRENTNKKVFVRISNVWQDYFVCIFFAILVLDHDFLFLLFAFFSFIYSVPCSCLVCCRPIGLFHVCIATTTTVLLSDKVL
jgi:hypothetical protein